MNKQAILAAVEARIKARAQEMLTDSVERMIRDGIDEDMIADFLGTAMAWNDAAIRQHLEETAAMLNREGIEHVRSMTFTDSSSRSSIH